MGSLCEPKCGDKNWIRSPASEFPPNRRVRERCSNSDDEISLLCSAEQRRGFASVSSRKERDSDDRISQRESTRRVERSYRRLYQRLGGRRLRGWPKLADRISVGGIQIRTVTVAGSRPDRSAGIGDRRSRQRSFGACIESSDVCCSNSLRQCGRSRRIGLVSSLNSRMAM